MAINEHTLFRLSGDDVDLIWNPGGDIRYVVPPGKQVKLTMYCPICGDKMIPERIECSDKSGWMFGWSCKCTAEMRDSHPELAEVIVHS